MLLPGREWQEGYRFGFGGQEKEDEISGNGNINTALFWEFDTRLGRRWNVDPMNHLVPFESPYCTFHENPIVYDDPDGDFGPLGALIGGAVGAIKEYGSQAVSGIVQGKSLKDALWNDVDWADVAISTTEGAIAGFTAGASLIVTQAVSAAARASIDFTASEGLDSWGGFIGDKKDPGDVLKDFISEGAGFAIGKGLEDLNISGRISNEFITKNSSINQIVLAEFIGQMAAAPFEAMYSGIADGMIYSPLRGNPISNWANLLNDKYQPIVILETVHVTATRVNNHKVRIRNIDLFNKTVEESAKKNRNKEGYE